MMTSLTVYSGSDAYTYTDEAGDLLLFNITTGESRVLMDWGELAPYTIHWVSPDLQYVLLAYYVRSVSIQILYRALLTQANWLWHH